MIFFQKQLAAFLTLSLLRSPAWAEKRDIPLSLWGKVADLTTGCSHWKLKPQVSIPALEELTVCLNVKLKVQGFLPWTIFMYRHPEVQYAELGMGGKEGRLVVWMFGEEWTTPLINLQLWRWYTLCVTWSHTKDRPTLYINGSLVNITAAHTSTPIAPPCCQLAPNGSLTLGVGHAVYDGNIDIIPYRGMLGKISLFRMWGRERSEEEVTSLSCTEGDLVKWEWDNWDTASCDPVSDTSLQCEWSFYEVNLQFVIVRYDKNTTEPYTARDIAHYWLRQVLPKEIYLHKVYAFEVTRSNTEEHIKTPSGDGLTRWATENISRFRCLAYTNVIPKWDVAALQREMYNDLSNNYTDPSGLLLLLADTSTIYTTPVESFSLTTIIPPVVMTGSSPITTSTIKTTSASTFTQPATTTHTITRTPANVSELYFEVKVNVSITGDCDPRQILPTWLNMSLPDDLMMVLDLQLLPKAERRHPERKYRQTSNQVSKDGFSRESFIFQVQVSTQQSDTTEMIDRLRQCLLMPYDNGSVSIAAEHVQISRILVLQCDAEAQQTLKGLFMWPDTTGGKHATCACPKNSRRSATRLCKLSQWTRWMEPNLEDCPPVVETIPDLDHVEVTSGTGFDVVEMIEDLLRNHSNLIYKELVTVLNKLKDIIRVSVVTPDLGQALINVISNILESDSNLGPFTNTILNLTEEVGDKMVGYEGSYTLSARALAISVVDVVPAQFSSLSFGVLSDWTGTNPEIFINRYPSDGTVAFISLPSVLQDTFPQHDLNQYRPRIQFQFYANPLLFKLQREQRKAVLNTFVVSASVTNASSPIKDLREDVKIMLHHLQHNAHDKVQCVYWNFNKNKGHGGWDDHGCRKYNSTPDYTTCLCDHLTHFGVLLDVSRTQLDPVHEQILTIITYVGCGVSSLFLGVTVVTYLAFEKLRRDYPSKILINLSLALLGLNLVFLVNSWLSSWGLYGLCVAAASTLHYFLLASFTWMGLEAVNMYFALVKVFNVYVPSYILKFCALGWGIPLVICILVLIVNRDAYGPDLYTDGESTFESLDNSGTFCWLQDDVAYFVSVVAYAGLIFLFNIGVFVVVLIQIRRMRFNSPAGTRRGLLQDLKGVASLTFLLGLTWTVGFLNWDSKARIVLLYLFAILNTLQGFFVFLFHCLMKENVRKQWRIYLCFGRFRLEEHSEWSNSASVGVLAKPREKFLRAAIPSVRSVKSNSTDSTSASSDSSQRDSSCRRPNLDLFVTSLICLPTGDEPDATRNNYQCDNRCMSHYLTAA
ncbi:adhesion G-protein coupled receptor G4 isoform 2-T2 [Fundulus diaphanus]